MNVVRRESNATFDIRIEANADLEEVVRRKDGSLGVQACVAFITPTRRERIINISCLCGFPRFSGLGLRTNDAEILLRVQ